MAKGIGGKASGNERRPQRDDQAYTKEGQGNRGMPGNPDRPETAMTVIQVGETGPASERPAIWIAAGKPVIWYRVRNSWPVSVRHRNG